MEHTRKELNYFFVTVFNQILSWEEQSFKSMGIGGITLRELHVIEAVFHLKEKGENRMSQIARYLAITPGSLTTAVNCLVKKGYLKRESAPGDRRVIMIEPTEIAKDANDIHSEYHSKMINFIADGLSGDEADLLVKVLEKVGKYFAESANTRS